MFGQSKFQNGVLIEPKQEYKFDPKDSAKLQEFRNMIWYVALFHPFSYVWLIPVRAPARRTIERANEFAPKHSRIFKEVRLEARESCNDE